MAEYYLTEIINKGKSENNFKTTVSTKVLANKILAGFRTYMKDEQRFHEVILEMKKINANRRIAGKPFLCFIVSIIPP